jgi:hypothetical protein
MGGTVGNPVDAPAQGDLFLLGDLGREVPGEDVTDIAGHSTL